MLSDKKATSVQQESLARARALRNQYAREAAAYAHRIEQASQTSQASDVARWTAEYRRSTAQCRRLGELIRGEGDAA
jgi:hypothetical protein